MFQQGARSDYKATQFGAIFLTILIRVYSRNSRRVHGANS
jgi:hypothetical protein